MRTNTGGLLYVSSWCFVDMVREQWAVEGSEVFPAL